LGTSTDWKSRRVEDSCGADKDHTEVGRNLSICEEHFAGSARIEIVCLFLPSSLPPC
jgi:hypothetical protein